MQKLIFTLVFCSTFIASILSQNDSLKYDYNWILGYKRIPDSPFVNQLDFNENPLAIKKYPVTNWPLRSPCPMSSKTGKLIFFANGCNVYGQDGNVLANGEQITPNQWVNNDYCPDYYPFTGSWMFLPDPARDSLFYLLAIGHHQSTGSGIYAWGLYANRLSEDGIFEKNILVCADSIFGGHLTACRHANGRDWWLVLNKIKTNNYYKYLLNPTGLNFVDIQSIGLPTNWDASGSGQSAFSSDGTKFIHYDNVTDMFVFDFNRCSGTLSDFRYVNILHNEDTGNSFGGMAISPNSRFAYTFGYLYSYQVDLQDSDLQSSVTEVAYWDSTTVNNVWKTVFGKAALGPDGMIYSAIPGSNPYLHIIRNPNAKGDSCQFEQNGLFLPYSWNNNDIVNFPNYRLGKMEGSPCDTVFTSLKEIFQVDEALKIIPNPNNGTFQIALPTGQDDEWNLEIFDLGGRSRWQAKANASKLQVSGLPAGFYFLVCTHDSDGRKVSQRLVIQH